MSTPPGHLRPSTTPIGTQAISRANREAPRRSAYS